VDAYDRAVRSVSTTVNIPSIIRLLALFQHQRVPAKFSRNLVYARDKHTCQYCGAVKTTQDLSCDHVVPRAHGGETTWMNIVTCCKPCKRRKAERTPDQAGMRLRKTPQQPTVNLALGLWARGEAMPEAWRGYLYWT
jgi:5-methylcytosine-specific restriction endonuclease McrA